MMLIDGVNITHEGFVPFNGELARYVQYVRDRVPEDVTRIHVKLCDDGCVDGCILHRSRRKIRTNQTNNGYLVGTIDRWNDSKQAEERDRVKHDPRLKS